MAESADTHPVETLAETCEKCRKGRRVETQETREMPQMRQSGRLEQPLQIAPQIGFARSKLHQVLIQLAQVIQVVDHQGTGLFQPFG